MTELVDRFGRTGFAALTSLVWALPMAAWAGSADLSPIDQTAYPWIALAIGLVMLIAWLVLISQLGRVRVQERPRRLDLRQMSSPEKRWTLAAIAFATGAIAWLNAAATVDWTPLTTAVAAHKLGPTIFATVAALFLIVMLAGAWLSWRKETKAFHRRVASARQP